jgi:predicted transcriptional regulator
MTDPTTVKLPKGLKRRIAPLAKAAGKTAHAWMVDTLVATAEREEQRRAFLAEALASKAEVDAGAPVFDLDDAFAYLRQRASGERATRPAPRKRSR